MIKNHKRELTGLDAALAGLTGASSLLEPPTQTAPATGAPLLVPLVNLHPDPTQARRVFEPLALRELADSIAEHGVIQPIVINTRADLPQGHWQILAGERRWRAASLAGLVNVPCVLKENKAGAGDEHRLVQQIVENVQRADLSPTELVGGYCRLVDEYGLSAAEIARQVGRSRQVIGEYLAVGRMDRFYRDALTNGLVRDVSTLVALWRLHDRDHAAADALLASGTPESPIRRSDVRSAVPGGTTASPTSAAAKGGERGLADPTPTESVEDPPAVSLERPVKRSPPQRDTQPTFFIRAEHASDHFVGVVSDDSDTLHTSAARNSHVDALLLAVEWLRSHLDQLSGS